MCAAALGCALSFPVYGQVTPQRLTDASAEPQNWLTYSGNYSSHRFSLLEQITPANVKDLKLQWVYQSPVAGNWQTSPIWPYVSHHSQCHASRKPICSSAILSVKWPSA